MQRGTQQPSIVIRQRWRGNPIWSLILALVLLVPGNVIAAAPARSEASASARTVAATFQVTFADEVPQQARVAFEAGVAIWAPLLNSTVPIQVAVTWKPGGDCSQACTLASAAATDMVQGFPNAPRADTRYPIALANSIAGQKLNTGADIEADFNSQANWYYGQGTPPAGQNSFISTAVHELAHGLGFSATLDYANGNGTFDSVPNIFDRFVVNGDNATLIDAFPNNSTALGQQLTSGNIFFNGTNARAAAGNASPKLFAPNPWQVGSSISHLDQATYIGGPNTLMTPSDEGGGVTSPGPITEAIFRDLGWPGTPSPSPEPGGPPPVALQGAPLAFPPDKTPFTVAGVFRAQWEQGGLEINGYPLSPVFQQRLEDGNTYWVQYFERVRMEYHPEIADPSYQVLLGQFGRRVLKETLGRDPDPQAQPIPGQTYDPVTGHNLDPRFVAYYQGRGGLAQFGRPLTETFTQKLEDGKDYEVQYFERARFEWHPENAAPYDVLLGQFGRQILAATPR